MSDTSAMVGEVAKDAMAGAPLGPIGMALGGAAGLISHYAPALLGALFGSDPAKAQPAAQAACAAVAQITGTSDPKQQLAVAQADPNVALELQVQLANLAVSLEEAKAQADRDAAAAALARQRETDSASTAALAINSAAGTAALGARMDDTDSARRMAEAYLASGQTDTRANVMVIGAALGLVACVCAGIGLMFLIKQDTQSSGMIIGLVVSVAGIFGNALLQAYGFEFGNSRSGRAQTAQMGMVTSQLMAHSANSVPVSALNQMNGGGGGPPPPAGGAGGGAPTNPPS
jgi:hypothetical protein